MTKRELEEVLRLTHNEDEAHVPLLSQIIKNQRANQSMNPTSVSEGCQTDGGESSISMEQKLKEIDYKMKEKLSIENAMPYKVLEERMVQYKRECDERVRREVEAEVKRVKELDLAQMRMEEASNYRKKINEFQEELDALHKEKIKDLK